MDIHKKLRGATAVAVAVLYNVIFTFPHLAIYLVLNVWRRDKTAFRNGMTARMTSHGERLFRWLCSILDVTVDFNRPILPQALSAKPLIVVSNHQSIMDIPLLFAVMQWLNLPFTRWIMKKEVLYLPFGWFSLFVDSAFVSRNKDKKDLMAVRRCGYSANQDGAAVVVFPEGTRFKSPIPESGLLHLRPAKKAGFDLLRQHMPNADIISVTLRWTENGQGRHGARTVFDADGFVGKCVTIRVEHIPADIVNQTQNWLEQHWREKDLQLAQAA